MKQILTTVILFTALTSAAQYTPEENAVERHLLKLSVISPGVEYELGVGRHSTLNLFGGVSPAFGYTSEEGFLYYLRPVGNLQFRYYYNLRGRGLRNKETDNNSADFLAIHLQGAGEPIFTNSDFANEMTWGAGVVWGIHRVLPNGIFLSGYLGPGILLDSDFNPEFTVYFGIRMGYTFFRRVDQEVRYRRLERDG